MSINTKDGTIDEYFSIKYTGSSRDRVPKFQTYGAIYKDEEDSIYTAFFMDKKL